MQCCGLYSDVLCSGAGAEVLCCGACARAAGDSRSEPCSRDVAKEARDDTC